MIVLKFGGTSVGTVASLRNVKEIVEGLDSPAIVVVSALGGLTDQLILTAKKAAGGDSSYVEAFPVIARRHREIIDELVLPEKKEWVSERVETLLQELFRLYDGLALIADLPKHTLDSIVSYGERMSSAIVSGIIKGAGYHHSPDIIKTEKWFDKDIADIKLTNELITKEFSDCAEWPAVMGGFISSDATTGQITNLGRGGSDYTAALVAAAMDAEALQIWTDVDGFMTSDPRVIPSARIIPEMTFVESMELCSFGAKVIYPPTIYPVFHKNIPIRILNTFNPSAPGTFISDRTPTEGNVVTGITTLKNTSLIEIKGQLCRNVAELNRRSYNALARHGISVFLVGQSADPGIFSFAVNSSDTEMAVKLLRDEFRPETAKGEITGVESTDGLSTLAIVGENISKVEGLTPRVINMLANRDIRTYASSNGTSKTTATFVIREDEAKKAAALVHGIFFPPSI